jgi:hypothetical protein
MIARNEHYEKPKRLKVGNIHEAEEELFGWTRRRTKTEDRIENFLDSKSTSQCN